MWLIGSIRSEFLTCAVHPVSTSWNVPRNSLCRVSVIVVQSRTKLECTDKFNKTFRNNFRMEKRFTVLKLSQVERWTDRQTWCSMKAAVADSNPARGIISFTRPTRSLLRSERGGDSSLTAHVHSVYSCSCSVHIVLQRSPLVQWVVYANSAAGWTHVLWKNKAQPFVPASFPAKFSSPVIGEGKRV